MRHSLLLAVTLLAGCEAGESNQAAGSSTGTAVQTAELTGLYEGRGEGGQRSQMCMNSTPSGAAAFGLVVNPGGASCSGAGEGVRSGNVLRLTMSGDQQCVIEARIDGAQVTFPAAVPAGCAYYCAPGGTLAGESFEKTGGTAQDAMRAVDLAGDPLCG